jgi:hypothetical protein
VIELCANDRSLQEFNFKEENVQMIGRHIQGRLTGIFKQVTAAQENWQWTVQLPDGTNLVTLSHCMKFVSLRPGDVSVPSPRIPLRLQWSFKDLTGYPCTYMYDIV